MSRYHQSADDMANGLSIPHWSWVPATAARAGIDKLAHTTYGAPASVSATSRRELDQIQFLLGHLSIQTIERCLGCKQKFRIAVNDRSVTPHCRCIPVCPDSPADSD